MELFRYTIFLSFSFEYRVQKLARKYEYEKWGQHKNDKKSRRDTVKTRVLREMGLKMRSNIQVAGMIEVTNCTVNDHDSRIVNHHLFRRNKRNQHYHAFPECNE